MGKWCRSVVASALVVLALTMALVAPALAKPKVVHHRHLAPGVTYMRIDDPAIPIHTFELIFHPGTRATLDLVLSAHRAGTYEKTSSMAASAGAIAAINGGFNSSPGRPTHQFVLDGRIITTGRRVGDSFGYRRNETGATVGHHPLRINAVDMANGASLRIASWNWRDPPTDGIVAYTPYGGNVAKPSTSQCSARLVSPTRARYNKGRNGVHRVYKVDAVACVGNGGTPMAVKAGSIVLSAKTSGRGATFVKNLRGRRVRLGWRADSPGVLDIVSGNAIILSHGKVRYSTSCTKSICNRNPRTAIGVTANDRVIMMVVDGRTSVSVGFTLHRLGAWMRRMGAVAAVNLDGGGSATMWIKGRGVVNHPTDSTGQRPVSNAVVVLPHRDRQESEPLPPH
jgi:hypothetical protein